MKDRICCDGLCVQGRECPRRASPIKDQPVIGTAPFIWTIVCIVAVGGAGWVWKGLVYLTERAGWCPL